MSIRRGFRQPEGQCVFFVFFVRCPGGVPRSVSNICLSNCCFSIVVFSTVGLQLPTVVLQLLCCHCCLVIVFWNCCFASADLQLMVCNWCCNCCYNCCFAFVVTIVVATVVLRLLLQLLLQLLFLQLLFTTLAKQQLKNNSCLSKFLKHSGEPPRAEKKNIKKMPLTPRWQTPPPRMQRNCFKNH